jgi:hypothetical protein
MNYSIQLNHEKKYIHYSHKGIIERKEIGEAWAQLLETEEFTLGRYNLLSDYRGATFNFTITETDVIEKFLESIKKILYNKRNSVIVDNPQETAISVFFEYETCCRLNFHVKTFSTEEAAVRFLIE